MRGVTFYPEDRLIVAERAIERAMCLTIACRFCHEPEGRECVNMNGDVLAHMAAHMWRMQDAGL